MSPNPLPSTPPSPPSRARGSRLVPDWLRAYSRDTGARDGLAALIVTLMLIPQSLAYAQLAGLPPQAGLYASIAPLLLYALFGSSSALAVGPVAVLSLMTAAALGGLDPALLPDAAARMQAAMALALLSGLMLLLMGLLRLGFLASFLSHPVIAGFITASGLLIATGQLKTLLNVRAEGQDLPTLLPALIQQLPQTHGLSLAIGLVVLAWLVFSRRHLKPLLLRLGLGPRWADLLSRAAPVAALIVSTALSQAFDWAGQGVKVVGSIPAGLPPLSLPSLDPTLWRELALPALLISIVGFVESVSVAQTLAAKRRERILPDRELIALGAGNLGAAFSGGYPVTGGFARSVVNFDAGARTPAAGVYTAGGILLAGLLLTPALYHLPQATLAATIIVAVLSLVDFSVLRRTWGYAKADFLAVAGTLLATLGLGVEPGLIVGVGISLALHLHRSSRPHIAEVGQVPGTESYRNVQRHAVLTREGLLGLRIDESLYFANARAVEDHINAAVAQHPELRHVVLQCSAINAIDASALESLEAIAHRLHEAGIALHLSEVKGPVMDRLQRSDFLQQMGGQVFLTHHQAVCTLGGEPRPSTPPTAAD